MHSKLNTTKKGSSSYELATIIKATQIFAIVLLTLTILSALTLSKTPSQSTANAESSSVTASVTVENSCTMSGSIETNKAHSATVQSGSYTADIGETLVSVNCNDSNGYSVYAIGYTSDVDGTTTLVGANTNLTIPTGTSTSTTSSNWAMKLSAVSGTSAPTILSDTNGSFASYHVVPSTATKVATLTSNTESSSSFKTTYAVAISNSQPADTYTGQVKYTLVHPNYTNVDGTTESYPITLDFSNTKSFTIDNNTYTSLDPIPNISHGVHDVLAVPKDNHEFVSWSPTGQLEVTDASSSSITEMNVIGPGTLAITTIEYFPLDYCASNNISDANCLQKMASNDCPVDTTKVAMDSRDGTTYIVQKLADNKCWMLDNLALNLTEKQVQVNLSDSTTNASNTTIGYLKNGGGTFSDRFATEGVKEWTSAPNTINDYIYTPRVATGGECYGTECANDPEQGKWTKDSIPMRGNEPATYGNGSGKIGMYYNFCAAAAGSSCSTSQTNVTEDICPFGWHLPTGGASSDYDALYTAYSNNTNAIKQALSTQLSGHIELVEEGKAGYQGAYGNFWSSTYRFEGSMYVLNVHAYPYGINVNTSDSIMRGLSIRCLAD